MHSSRFVPTGLDYPVGQPYSENISTLLLSLKTLEQIVKKQKSRIFVVNSTHPRDSKINQDAIAYVESLCYSMSPPRRMVLRDKLNCTTEEIALAADYIITGFSTSALTAAVASANSELEIIPICLLWDELIGKKIEEEKGIKKFPLTENGSAIGIYGEYDYDKEAFQATLQKALFDPDYQKAVLQAQKKNYCLDPKNKATDKVIEAIKQYL